MILALSNMESSYRHQMISCMGSYVSKYEILAKFVAMGQWLLSCEKEVI